MAMKAPEREELCVRRGVRTQQTKKTPRLAEPGRTDFVDVVDDVGVVGFVIVVDFVSALGFVSVISFVGVVGVIY